MGTKWLSGCGAALLALSAPALAVDGVREINHTCATTTGCFTGDTANYPVTITGAGSYRLTSNLTLANANTDAILVATADVSIDLNGFAITGITTCSGTPTTCSNIGVGRGIASSGPQVPGLSVRNGTVSKMGAIGIYVGDAGQVQDMRVISNGSTGIYAFSHVQVRRCTLDRNGQGGIIAALDALVADNVVARAGGTEPAIRVDGGIVRGNSVYSSPDGGIFGGSVIQIADNTLDTIDGNGIEAGLYSTISRNTIKMDDSSGHGIVADDGSRISGNSITMGNFSGLALSLDAGCGYADNVIMVPYVPPWISSAGYDLGGNLCNGGLCP